MTVFMMLQFVILAAGCQRKNSESKQSNETAKGRYVEEKLEIDGFSKGLFQSSGLQDGHLVLYGIDDKEACFYQLTRTNEGTWDKTNCKEINEINQNGKEYVKTVIQGLDGKQYCLAVDYQSDAQKNYMYVNEDDGIHRTNLDFELTGKYDGSSVINLWVLKNHTVLFQTMDNELYCIEESGKELYCIQQASSVCVTEDSIYAVNLDTYSVVQYDIDGKQKRSFPCEIKLTRSELAYCNGCIYLVNSTGLYCHPVQGTKWQQIIDGNYLISSAEQVNNLYVDEVEGQPRFYLISTQDYCEYSIYQYTFDPTLSVHYEKTLTIQTMEENETIQQAVRVYRQKHPEIDVVVNTVEDGVYEINTKDAVNALNTALLSENGPDMIVTDGYPEESYVNKGIFADVTKVIQSLCDDGTLEKGIMEGYKKDGHYYTVPSRFQLPIIYGPEETIRHMESLQELTDYLKQNDSEGFDLRDSEITKTMLKLYYGELINDQKQLNQDAFLQCLELIELLYQQNELKGIPESVRFQGEELQLERGFQYYKHQKDDKLTRIKQIISNYEASVPYCAQREADAVCESFQSSCIGVGNIGIRKGSSYQKEAEEFLRILYSEEVQKADTKDGLPVNHEILQKSFTYERLKDGCCIVEDGGEYYEYQGLSKAQIQDLHKLIGQVHIRYNSDSELFGMMEEAAETYLRGSASKEQVAADLKNKIDLYLSE